MKAFYYSFLRDITSISSPFCCRGPLQAAFLPFWKWHFSSFPESTLPMQTIQNISSMSLGMMQPRTGTCSAPIGSASWPWKCTSVSGNWAQLHLHVHVHWSLLWERQKWYLGWCFFLSTLKRTIPRRLIDLSARIPSIWYVHIFYVHVYLLGTFQSWESTWHIHTYTKVERRVKNTKFLSLTKRICGTNWLQDG